MLARKLLHAASALLGLAVLILPKPWSVGLLGAVFVGFALVDIVRLRWGLPRALSWVRWYFKREEGSTLSGATSLTGSFFFVGALFPPEVAGFSILFVALGDPLAWLMGKLMPILRVGQKSLGGSTGFLLVGLVLALALPSMGFWVKIFASLVGCVVELLTQGIDDNLTVPVAVSLSLVLLT